MNTSTKTRPREKESCFVVAVQPASAPSRVALASSGAQYAWVRALLPTVAPLALAESRSMSFSTSPKLGSEKSTKF